MAELTNVRIIGVHNPEPDGGKWGNRLGASIDSYQAGLYGVGEALTGSDWMRRRREANEEDAAWQREQARRQGAISSYKDIEGVGDFFDYAGGLAIDSAPYMAEAIAGGLTGGSTLVAGRLARAGLSRGAARTLGGVAASYPSSVGDILQNQRDESGTTNLGAALAGGVPYAGLNALGIEGALARGTLTRSGIRALDEVTGLKGVGLRTGTSMLKNAAVEGPAETGQELINQSFGRMAVNPDQTLFNPEANERYAESFVGGATLGGLFGGAAGGWRRSEGYMPPGQTVDDGQADLLAQPPRLDPDAQYGLQGDLFDGAGYDTTANGSRGTLRAADTDTSESLRQELSELAGLRQQAYEEGNTALGEAVDNATRDIMARLRLLESPDGPDRQMNLMSGVNEMVNGVPVELTTDELNQNMLPFVGDTNIDFPMGGQTYDYQGGLDFDSAYDPVQEGRPLPNLTTQLDPLQQRIDQNLGINRQGVGRNYPSQFQAASSEPTNQFTQNPDGTERRLDIGEFTALQAGVQPADPATQRAQAVGQEVKQAQQTFQQTAQRAAAAGLDPKKPQHVKAWDTIERAIDEGVITQEEGARLAAGLATKTETPASIQKFITGKTAQTNAVNTANAEQQQADLDRLQGNRNGNTVVAASGGAATQTAASGSTNQSSTATSAAPAVPATGTGTTGSVATGAAAANTRQQGAIAGIDPNKRVKVGRKGREKELTPAELVARMAKATEVEKGRVAAATGLEAVQDPTTGATRLVVTGEPMTLDAIAERESQTTGKKVPRETIRLSLLKFGITPEVIDRLQGVAADTVTEAELGIDPTQDGSGFRVENELSKTTGQGLVEGDTETKAQREARQKADELLKQAGPSTAVAVSENAPPTNLPPGAVVTDLREGNAAQVDANVRAILRSPQASGAASAWDSEAATWDEMPDTIKADWVEAYVDNLRMNEGELDYEQAAQDRKDIERTLADFRANAGRNSPGIAGPESRQTTRPADGTATDRGRPSLGRDTQTLDVEARVINQDVLGGPPALPINQDVIGREGPETRASRTPLSAEAKAKLQSLKSKLKKYETLVACLSGTK